MALFAVPERPRQPLRFPHAPVVTQHLSPTQATSALTTRTNQQSSASLSPAVTALRHVSMKAHQYESPAETSSIMARDNGKRGSYRHVSGSLAKVRKKKKEKKREHKRALNLDASKLEPPSRIGRSRQLTLKQAATHVEHERTSPVCLSPTDGNVSPPLPTDFKNLNRARIDDLGLLGDRFFDRVPSTFNAKYPTMAIPGAMPRRSLSPQQVGIADHPLTWTQMTIAGGLWAFAVYGFLFTMYSGVSAIVAYLWALVAELLGKGA